MLKPRFRTRRAFLRTNRGSYLLGSSWRMGVPWQIITSKKNPLFILSCTSVVAF
uniref:Uncharacterized protein n=1 Tax=Aegilops tauschii subsp. strangulata TaxID=200361 RepID=A0A453PBR0_AEGTS